MEILKQKLQLNAQGTKRYDKLFRFYRQNYIFPTDLKKIYRENGKTAIHVKKPTFTDKVQRLWQNIWSCPNEYNPNIEWIKR